MSRYLLLFAREPAREAREKGFRGGAGADLFLGIARGWLEAARGAGAELVIASPPEDRATWHRRLGESPDLLWIDQRGGSFGDRLRDAASRVASLGGTMLIVGGDVVPRGGVLPEAFALLETSADSLLGPSPDGGVSVIGLAPADLHLLGAVPLRKRNVFAALHRALLARGRRVAIAPALPDVDGRRSLGALLRRSPLSDAHRPLLRLALDVETSPEEEPPPRPARFPDATPLLRAPPAAA